VDGREAAACDRDINAHTRVRYAVDGEVRSVVVDPVSSVPPDELPEALRGPCSVAGIGAPGYPEWSPAENFRLVCALAGLTLALDDIRRLPLLGAAAG
jgi:hypothetical protein